MEEKPSLSRRFPADIEAEILLRLPVKTLKRFECVCKWWFSLISSPRFQNDHFRRAHQYPLILTLHSDASLFEDTEVDDLTLRFSIYNKDGTPVKKFTKPVPQPYFDSRVAAKPFLQSCQGLVCISSLSQPILVCNPATEEIISLPYLEELNYCFGFGYAASTHEFKVVRIVYSQGRSGCEVFTLGTTHWKQAPTPPYAVSQGTAPFLHGAIHFLREIEYDGVKPTDHIAAFDIETEIYRVIPLPDYYHSLGNCTSHNIANPSDFLRLSKLGGELCLTFDFGELDERLEVWILKDYNNGEWVKEYNISVSSLYFYPNCSYRVFPSDNMGDESILLNCADLKAVKVLCYNTKDDIVTLMKDNEWGATFYVESFYRLHANRR